MEHALLEVTHLKPRKVLLRYDDAAHKEKLKHQPQLYATSSSEDCEVVSADSRVAAYTSVLDFITGAQQECYALFGDDEGRWVMDDTVADDVATTTRGDSVPVNSQEWSEEDSAHDATAAARKRQRQHL